MELDNLQSRSFHCQFFFTARDELFLFREEFTHLLFVIKSKLFSNIVLYNFLFYQMM